MITLFKGVRVIRETVSEETFKVQQQVRIATRAYRVPECNLETHLLNGKWGTIPNKDVKGCWFHALQEQLEKR